MSDSIAFYIFLMVVLSVNKKWLGCFLLGYSQFMIGGTMVATKYLAPMLPNHFHMGGRFLFSTIILLAVNLCSRPRDFRGEFARGYINIREWALLFLLALTGGFLFNYFLVKGLELASATSGGIIISSTPVFIAILAFIFLKEVIQIHKWIAILLALSGVVTLNLQFIHGSVSGPDSFIGDLLLLIAVIPEASYTILMKFLGNRIHPLTMAVIINAFISLMFFPFAMTELSQFSLSELSTHMLIVLFLESLCSAQFYVLWQAGLKFVPASTAGIYMGFLPIGALIFSMIFLEEHINLLQACGMLLILMGIYIGTGVRVDGAKMRSISV